MQKRSEGKDLGFIVRSLHLDGESTCINIEEIKGKAEKEKLT